MLRPPIYLATPRNDNGDNPALWNSNKGLLLDVQVRRFQQAGYQVNIVIGQDGDELLLQCRTLEDCDLVFDPSPQSSWESQAKAVAQTIDRPAWVWPVQRWCSEMTEMARLEQSVLRTEVQLAAKWVQLDELAPSPRLILRGELRTNRVRRFGRASTEDSAASNGENISSIWDQQLGPKPNLLLIENPSDFQGLISAGGLDFSNP